MSDVLVIAKPAGWEVYDRNAERQLADFVVNLSQGHLPILKDFQHSCGFIHRLDVPSSGLVMAATSYEAWYDLQLQLVTGSLLREYLVLAHGILPRDRVISASLRWIDDAVSAGQVGKPSVTNLRVVGHLQSWSQSFTMLVIRIVTGRKHQIRSHLAWVGHPTLCEAWWLIFEISCWLSSFQGKNFKIHVFFWCSTCSSVFWSRKSCRMGSTVPE